MIPWRHASAIAELPHRRYQGQAPNPPKIDGSLIYALTDYDSKKQVQNALKSDTFYWKGNHFIKTKKDQDLVVKLYEKHFIKLKDLFIFYASQNARAWPYIDADSALKLCKDILIMEQQKLSKETILKHFALSNIENSN